MQGPYQWWTLLRGDDSEFACEVEGLSKGGLYRVAKMFQDADGDIHPSGEEWSFIGATALNKDGVQTLRVQRTNRTVWTFSLSKSVPQQQDVLEHLHEYLAQHDPKLDGAAYQLASEIRDGKWGHVMDPRIKQPAADRQIIDELRRRCPGYTMQQYQSAIAKGMHDSMW